MSAILSLLRVMALRDAEAIMLETGKVPALRRAGNIEQLAMPALEPALLTDFVTPLLGDRSLDSGSVQVPFDADGVRYAVTIEKSAAGLRIVARKGKAAAPPPAATSLSQTSEVPARAGAWWASGAASASAAPAPHVPANAAHAAAAHAAVISPGVDVARDALARLLAPALAIARDRGASDVIVSTGHGVHLRVDGQLEALDVQLDDTELVACVSALGNNADLSLTIGSGRTRINVFEHLSGSSVAVRLIRDRVPTLNELGLPPELEAVIEQRDGLVLVCGPTGSGKSTTLAALIDRLDQRRAAHVITLEDPIEYRFAGRRCLIHQREVGTHIPSFERGITAALREAPDVILLGELRDRDTIAAALTAAETGHLVLATLHAPSAAGAIDRIIDVFPDTQQRQIRWQLASVLRTVITQYLLPRRDGGRVAAVEYVPITNAVANLMRKGDLHMLPTAISTGRDAGMIPLERSLAKLLDAGTVASSSVKRIAADHDLLAALASKLR